MIEFAHCQCKVKVGEFNINKIPLDCPAVWKLVSCGHTVGIFQLEKKLGQDWAKKVRPDDLEALAALTALLRPGPLEAGMTQDYVEIKAGVSKPSYIHQLLEPILSPTYGCLVYQEQAIRIATDLAGFSPENADELRKAIGKKKPELMARIKNKFIDGCEKHQNIPKGMAEEIFGWIEKCQRYSFNKSHAICYGMIAYQTAWVKCHFPQEFFTSYLTYSAYKRDPKEEIYKLVQDARLFGIRILPPDIRRNNIHFAMVPDQDNGVAFGLSHIRGVGQSAIQKIIAAVSDGQSTSGLVTWGDFVAAVPDLHRNVGIALIKSGACDCYQMERATMVQELEVILGTTIRDDDGKKVEVKGLTKREKEYFFRRLSDGLSTREVLLEMGQTPEERPKSISQMKKSELVVAAKNFLNSMDTIESGILDDDSIFVHTSQSEKDGWLEDLSKRTKINIVAILRANGYKENIQKPPCSSEARRQKVMEKADILDTELFDNNKAKAAAEKHFLGIALSCSEADDADDSNATHTCLDIARANNDETIITCVIIDNVKHTKTKRGRNPGSPMCFLTISDSTYSIDHAVVFPDTYMKLKGLCKEDLICMVYGHKKNGSFIVQDIQKLI